MSAPASRLRLFLAAVLFCIVVTAAALTAGTSRAATVPYWIDDLAYGSAGGGFYWDPVSGQVWTAERSWHLFGPQPPRVPALFWLDDLGYGSAGGGFYWDPVSGQVWTAERDWHVWNPRPVPSRPPSATPPRIGEIIESKGSWYRVNAILNDYKHPLWKPDPGNRFFVFDVTQGGTVDGDPYNPYYFDVQTTDAFVYSCSSLGSPEPGFHSGDLAKGQRVRGFLACEIPSGATVARILTEPEVFGTSIVLADLSLGTVPSSSYPTGARPTGPAVGTAVTASGSRYTVNQYRNSFVPPVWKPDPGNRFAAFDVTQEAYIQGDPYNPLYFSMQTADDYVYDCSSLGAPEPGFQSGDLNAGQKVRGWVACEMPLAAAVVAIFVEPDPLGGSIVIAVP